jgi:tartrate-resistant acid phosphatase type 5
VRWLRTLVLLFVALRLDGDPLPEVSLAPKKGVLRLAVTGDTGSGADAVATAIARVHGRQALDAIILTGDNFYPCGVTSAEDPRWKLVTPLTRIGVPVLPVLGNHDYCGQANPDAQIGALVPNWVFPGRSYVVRAGIADFAFVDTDPYVKGTTSSLRLAEAFASSKARWRIVVGHHPVLSSGWHGYFPRDEVKRMRDAIPALRAVKADLFIAGHDHHVELLRGRMRHLISGAGSSPIPPVKLRLSTVYPDEIRRERIGFAVVEIRAESIRVRFYDQNGRPKSGWL